MAVVQNDDNWKSAFAGRLMEVEKGIGRYYKSFVYTNRCGHRQLNNTYHEGVIAVILEHLFKIVVQDPGHNCK